MVVKMCESCDTPSQSFEKNQPTLIDVSTQRYRDVQSPLKETTTIEHEKSSLSLRKMGHLLAEVMSLFRRWKMEQCFFRNCFVGSRIFV